MSSLTTRIFKNGNSQAVRIPHEFRLNTTQVEISRSANGDLIIHPIPVNLGATLLAVLNDFDDDFIKQLEQNEKSQTKMQDRDAL